MRGLRLAPFGAALVLLTLTQADLAAGEEDQVERGQYLVRAGGCFSCHTAKGGEKLAGGRPLTTPFGTFYSPNNTPDPDTGIGRWADAQFLRALRDGVRPDGANYFPVFPYPSFTGITDSNALAMKAYLFSLPPVHQQNRPHDVPFPISLRWLQTGWSCCSSPLGHSNPLRTAVSPTIGELISSLRSRIAESATLHAIFSALRRLVSSWQARRMGLMVRSFPISRPIRQPGSAGGIRMKSSNY